MVIKITFKIKIMNNNLKIEFMEIITNNSHNNTKKTFWEKSKNNIYYVQTMKNIIVSNIQRKHHID